MNNDELRSEIEGLMQKLNSYYCSTIDSAYRGNDLQTTIDKLLALVNREKGELLKKLTKNKTFTSVGMGNDRAEYYEFTISKEDYAELTNTVKMEGE